MFRVVKVRLLTTKFLSTLFPTGRMFGDKCRADYECAEELNLVCSKNELRTCHCRRGYMWNTMHKICYRINEVPYDNGMQWRASFSLEASSMEQSPSWEAIRFSASQEIPRILWKPKIDYRVYKNSPPVPVPSQINLFHANHPQISCHFSII